MKKLLIILLLASVLVGCNDNDQGERYEKWDNGKIRYHLDSSCSDYEKKQFRLRAQEWNDKTNIEFVEYDVSGDYICSVYKTDRSFASGYGKHKDCYIELKDFNDRINILHEQAHLILGPHPHQEPRRDFYVSILYDNIIDSKKKYFVKKNAWDFPYDYTKWKYDYDSCLHYQGWEHSKNGNKTIVSITDEVIGSIGISTIDIEKVNAIYE